MKAAAAIRSIPRRDDAALDRCALRVDRDPDTVRPVREQLQRSMPLTTSPRPTAIGCASAMFGVPG